MSNFEILKQIIKNLENKEITRLSITFSPFADSFSTDGIIKHVLSGASTLEIKLSYLENRMNDNVR